MSPERLEVLRRAFNATLKDPNFLKSAKAARLAVDNPMTGEQLAKEIAHGIVFWVGEENGRLLGVMGIQDKGAVALVRHAYVAPTTQRKGVGTQLLRYVEDLTSKPILIGTWADASWAIDFYRRNGFTVVSQNDKEHLLRTYWSIPERQIETSVVLADRRWIESQRAGVQI